jgi:putative nucleotidyltransferase with HDIG domain/PAS domain S-box-containing protein
MTEGQMRFPGAPGTADRHPLSIQDVLDAFPYYVMIVTDDHRVVAANAALYQEFGVSAEEVIGSHCPASIHGLLDGERYPACPIDLAVSTGEDVTLEVHDEDTGRWMLTAAYSLARPGQRLFLHTALDITAHKKAEQRERDTLERLHETLIATANVTARAVEAKDPYTAGHQRRVAELSAAIATALGYDATSVEAVRVAGVVHDLGKIGIPSEILNKPGRLTAEEYDFIKQHPSIGSAILEPVDFPWPIAQIVQQHHERIDGSGYPHGLRDGDIMPESRIIAVADVVEAMSLPRPYRAGLGVESALEEIERGSGTLFDPDVVAACSRLFRDDGFVMAADEAGAPGFGVC